MVRTGIVTILSTPILLVPYELGVLNRLLHVGIASIVFGVVYLVLSIFIVIDSDERRRLFNAGRRMTGRTPVRAARENTHAPPG